MQKSRKKQNVIKKLKRAFTLYELILVCAMLVLISGIVVSLVVFMNSYSNRTEENSDLVTALVDLREQVDIWFSRMDNEEYEIITTPKTDTMNGVEVTKWAYCVVGEDEYFIGSYMTDDGCRFTFCSDLISVVWSDTPLQLTLNFTEYTDDFVYEKTENVRLRFLVNLPVRGEKYICEVIYAGTES